MPDLTTRPVVRQVLFAIFVAGLAACVWMVLSPFLASIAWAGILAYASWPAYRRVHKALRLHVNAAAFLMTLAMTAAVILPVLWLAFALKWELTVAIGVVSNKLSSGGIVLPRFIADLPFVGTDIAAWLNKVVADPAHLKAEIHALLSHTDQAAIDLIGGISRNLAKMGFALVTLFFAYRGGASFVSQSERILESMLGVRVRGYYQAAGDATRGVVYGIVLTAIAQGLVAGLGYWVLGLDAPFTLTAITTLVALIPFATPLVWGSLALWLILTGDTSAGVGLLLWGTLMVSWVDNVIRPIVLAQQVKIPFILAFFGVLGGLPAFGLVGLFLGPVILAVAFAVWQEWLDAHPESIAKNKKHNEG